LIYQDSRSRGRETLAMRAVHGRRMNPKTSMVV
jgi:hypothetical protein